MPVIIPESWSLNNRRLYVTNVLKLRLPLMVAFFTVSLWAEFRIGFMVGKFARCAVLLNRCPERRKQSSDFG